MQNRKGQAYCCAEPRSDVMKWMDKKSVSFILTFHSDTMVAVSKRGRDPYKPRGK
jgi:hypothetical protein